MITLTELVALAALITRAPVAPTAAGLRGRGGRGGRGGRRRSQAVAVAGARHHRARGGAPWWRLLRRRAAGRAVAAPRVVRGCAAAAGFARQLAAAGLSPGCLGPVRSWAWAVGREILSARVHPCGTARSAQPSMCARARWCVSRQN